MQALQHFWHTLIHKLNHHEQQLQLLASIPQFEPFTTFRRLDQDRNGEISKKELSDFFSDHNILISVEEIDYLFSQLDLNSDGKVTYTDFGRYILPKDDKLKLEATQRNSYYIDVNMFLPEQIEHQLKRILEYELINFREIYQLKEELLRAYNLDIDRIYAELDLDQDGTISEQDLHEYLKNNHIDASSQLIKDIIKKFDKDHKNKSQGLNLNQLFKHLSINPQSWEQIQVLNNKRQASQKELQKHIQQIADNQFSNNIIGSTQISQPQYIHHVYSPQQVNRLNYSIPVQNPPLQHSLPIGIPQIHTDFSLTQSLNLGTQIHHISQPLYQAPLNIKPSNYFEENRNLRSFQDSEFLSVQSVQAGFDQLINFFNLIVTLNKELEIIKQKLDFQHDFNIQQLFHFFSFANTQFINETSFLDSLVHLRIEPSQAELSLFLKLIGGSQISYQQFCQLILPQDSSKHHIQYAYRVEEKFLDFSFETLQILAQVLVKILNNEGQIEDYRRMHRFNLHLINDAFVAIDEGSKGYFTFEDFTKFLQNRNVYYSGQEYKNLYERIDRNKDRKVCQQEFILELVPLPH